MASIHDVSVSSDSEDDADYIPTGDVALSESSGGEENASEDKSEAPKPKRGKTKKSVKKKMEVEESETTNVKDPKDIKVDPKKHDDIWKRFLSEVEATSAIKSSTVITTDVAEIASSSTNTSLESASIVLNKPTANVFEFAGETFTVDNNFNPVSILEKTKVVERSTSTEGKRTRGLPKKRGGIDSVIGTLSKKKQKMTTMQKTLYDWKSFKASEGIEDDLEKFNKGRGGFIERQRFLQRSDVRSFETEKNIRQSRKKK